MSQPGQFKDIVAEFIGYDASSGAYNEDKVKELAGEFESAKIWIVYWAKGSTAPHPLIQKQVVKYIFEQRKP